MSGPRTIAVDAAQMRTLTERLKAEIAAPLHRPSATEERLLAIAKTILIECVMCVRANLIEKTGEPIDQIAVNEAVMTEAARLALAAAVEMEAPLRLVRERMEGRR